jgi:hypothetical protein
LGIGTSRAGSLDGIGCEGRVVVFFDGSNTIGSNASRLSGQIPVFANAERIVDFFKARSRASE